ncbi:FAD-dependent oxidoreductase [Aeromicrobium panaciterrae]|uniref:NAD(P)/FAD-dependent oxidoreductase n=1 Tax=Aeromicrobium panaciterrae TaxID=363861 RepID=UPI0031DDE145
MLDAIVVGGGPAGLQATLTLGRMHRDVLLLDSGAYRNATVEHMQNLITHDGRDPAELRELARKDIAAYDTAEIREATVDEVRRTGDTFEVLVGDEVLAARRIILATGVRDTLPDIPGIAEAWGREIAHCPYCHGHEFAGERVAILGTERAEHLGALLGNIASELIVLERDTVREVERTGFGLRIMLDDETIGVGGMFIGTEVTQSAPFAEQLGVTRYESGFVEVDPMGRTNVPGVYAAGDLAHIAALPGPMPSVATAIAAGAIAGSVCNMELAQT